MSVTTSYAPNVSTANGVTVAFPFDFLILAETDLKVTVRDLDGVDTVLTLGTDYTVSGVGNPAGGVATLVAPPADQYTVIRERDMPYTRGSDYQELGDLTSAALNRDLDRPVLMLQQLAAILNNTLRLATGDNVGPLPPLVPNGYLQVNSTGDGFTFPLVVDLGAEVTASPFGADLVQAANSTAAKSLLLLGAFQGTWDEVPQNRILCRGGGGSGPVQTSFCSDAGFAFLFAADVPAQRAALALGDLATKNQAEVTGLTNFARLAEKQQVVNHISAGALTINLALGHVVELNQSANITSLAFSNPPAAGFAATVTILRKKDNSGTARTIAWGDGSGTVVKWPNGGAAPSLTQSANAEDLITLISYDGQNWRGGAGLNFA